MVPVWVRDEVGSPTALGLLSGIGGGAAVLGNVLGAWVATKLPRRLMFSVSFLLAGAPRFAVMALTDSLVVTLVVWAVAEVFSGNLNPVIGAVSYERIPPGLRARVLGVIRSTAWLGLPFGALAGGYATEAWGLTAALWAFGAAYLVTTLAPFVFPTWRQLDRRPQPVHVGPPGNRLESTARRTDDACYGDAGS
jgi:predicted MFS family arabinose efflux permease